MYIYIFYFCITELNGHTIARTCAPTNLCIQTQARTDRHTQERAHISIYTHSYTRQVKSQVNRSSAHQ